MLRELKGRMRAFRNMHSVTVLNVPQLRELSVSVAFMDVKEVKMENASLLGKCEELKRVVEKKKSDDVVVRVKDVGVLPVEKRVVENDCCCDEMDSCTVASIVGFVFASGLGCIAAAVSTGFHVLVIVGFVLWIIAGVFAMYHAFNNPNCCR